MNRIISHADGIEVLQKGDGIVINFLTISPECIYKNSEPQTAEDVITQRVSVYISRENIKKLSYLISEYTI